MAAVSATLLLLLSLARISGLVVALLVLFWALAFKSSFLSHPASQEDVIYSVLHPLLMVIGFILVSGEAILVHRWLPGSRSLKKSVHLSLQGVALASGIFGIWTKFHGEDGLVANFYSLHSWMGLICMLLFGAQWVMGFLSFWHRGEVRRARIRVLPWHIFFGLYIYGLAVATAETGLLEKLTFLQTKRNLAKRCLESMVVNGLGLGLVLLSGIVILAAVSPKNQTLQTKLVCSDTKGLPWLIEEVMEVAVSYDAVLGNSGGGGVKIKNHAMGLGGHTIDDCGEFMVARVDDTLDALKYAIDSGSTIAPFGYFHLASHIGS